MDLLSYEYSKIFLVSNEGQHFKIIMFEDSKYSLRHYLTKTEPEFVTGRNQPSQKQTHRASAQPDRIRILTQNPSLNSIPGGRHDRVKIFNGNRLWANT